ncbi:MAG: methylenetetrahydrofolate reductase [NAD(P)H] [Proteobacteria bacterium]|nr:methylenetetrahydrofolate reductase [NAD(P)H] [Pseudomonadota bacterium]
MMIAAPLPSDVTVSFEFFPPTTDAAVVNLWASIQRLAPLRPAYVSVTYGAGGTTRERTHATVVRIRRETEMEPAAHLTCIGASKTDIDAVAQSYWDAGIRHIVTLRGDAPEGAGTYTPHPDGYAFAADLVAGLKRVAPFEISVAAYPETHPEAKSPADDLDNLKRKVDAGAARAITQFFFNPEVFLRFLDRVRAAGITIPVIPGIMPVTNFRQTAKFAIACGASVPLWMYDLFEGLDEDPITRQLVAASVAAEQCRVLHASGVDAFHFYTMNKADLCYAICHVMGVRTADAAA